jgi:hypothetical protein
MKKFEISLTVNQVKKNTDILIENGGKYPTIEIANMVRDNLDYLKNYDKDSDEILEAKVNYFRYMHLIEREYPVLLEMMNSPPKKGRRKHI